MLDVVAIGELLIDFTTDWVQEDGYPVMAAHPGGAVANYLAPLAKYGKKTALIAKVGNDAFGNQLLKTVAECGISTECVKITDAAFTTLAFVTRDENGEREFSFARKPGADLLIAAEEIDYSIIDGAKVLHFGSVSLTGEPSRSAHHHVVEYAKSAGKLISFDPNLRMPLWADLDEAKKEIQWGLSQADIIKISDSEIEFLYGCTPEEGANRLFEDYSPKLVFVTMGKDGCYFKNSIAEGKVSAVSGLDVIDTTGAGDIFGGTAMFGVLNAGTAPEQLSYSRLLEIARFACTAASLSTTKLGGVSSVPELEEVNNRI